MKYTTDYSKLSGQARIDKGVQDCKEYIDDIAMWHTIENYCRSCKSEDEVRGGLGMFVGIEGYPVVAMWETYKQDKETDNGKTN